MTIHWLRTSEVFECFSVARDDNGLIAIGNKNAGSPENRLYIVKTDSNGNKLWEKTVSSTIGSTIGLVGYTRCIDSRGAGFSRLVVVEVSSQGKKISSRIIDKEYDLESYRSRQSGNGIGWRNDRDDRVS